MVEELLLGIGKDDQNLGPIFTPNDVKKYQEQVLSKQDPFDPSFIDMLTKALLPDQNGQITKDQLSEFLKQHKI